MYFHLGWIETPLETHPRKIETAVVVSTMWKIILWEARRKFKQRLRLRFRT